MRNMLRGVAEKDSDGVTRYIPMFYVTENCRYFIDILPTMQRDENNWEDMDSDGPDHPVDMTRYVLMSRPGAGVTKGESLEDEMGGDYGCEGDFEEMYENFTPESGYGPADINTAEGLPVQ
jgi:hypothetical protein